MTNKSLSNFKNSIHHSLKAKEKNGCLCVSEQEESSVIGDIYFNKGNNDDILIIQQDITKCRAIENLFEKKSRVDSCDFIILICKNRNLHIFFCEIKSSNSQKNREKALDQINSSKIFLEYLYKNYKQHFKADDFDISLENAKNIYIYPASISSKSKTSCSGNSLESKPIKIDSSGNANIDNVYGFLGI
ncbi:hypothetical protein [Campylobacter vulpis]|uniref:hypothetical protein n=1 Tax=Campylobacter vulpis TaxID=1655500 RepID=UPI000C14F696|nr:hypothetical protein [Campylobacter vulpis]MBS4274999.1 hypothetical protein [Campylobacter vulpis]MBS4306160.1 hypothetical protein [Campylobacter vulpis]MBS4329186.1 hypothetical protein [Campylobacter vulpis]MBS4422722.1 hypothetical protein [Campylobacter vulpis]PHY92032.1 hypothetical protein AA995_01615 [Campylobacter vulpis]